MILYHKVPREKGARLLSLEYRLELARHGGPFDARWSGNEWVQQLGERVSRGRAGHPDRNLCVGSVSVLDCLGVDFVVWPRMCWCRGQSPGRGSTDSHSALDRGHFRIF